MLRDAGLHEASYGPESDRDRSAWRHLSVSEEYYIWYYKPATDGARENTATPFASLIRHVGSCFLAVVERKSYDAATSANDAIMILTRVDAKFCPIE